MQFGDCRSQCRLVDYLVRSQIIFGLVRNCFGRHNSTRSAQIKLAWSSHHFSGALAVARILLLVGALVGTLNIRPVLGALIISNCSPAFLRLCIPFLLQVCLLSIVWVSISSFSESTCGFISRCTVDSSPRTLVDCASDLSQGTLID